MNSSFDISNINNSSLSVKTLGPSVYSDNQSLNGIRKQAQTDSKSAIEAAAKEFEAFFMNEMLKSMRQASEVIGDDSMFSSSEEKMFVGMLDEQMSVDLSQQGSLGIAKMMLRELSPEGDIQSSPFIKKMPKIKSVQVTHDHIPEKNETLRMSGVKELVEASSSTSPLSNVTAEKKSLFSSVSEFIKELMPLAKKSASKIGVDPKILVAQAALETGWGKHIIHNEKGQPSFNLFGIKNNESWKGESVKIDTLEVENGEFIKRKESFRSYDSFEKSFDDLVNFISENPRYKKAMEVVDDAKQFIRSVQEAGYATDPNYAKKIIDIFGRDDFSQPLNDK